MGIFLLSVQCLRGRLRLPHAGGDIPSGKACSISLPPAAPRRWGYSFYTGMIRPAPKGCPTQVGIFLTSGWPNGTAFRLPHAGGDIPFFTVRIITPMSAAPRRWGYSLCCKLLVRRFIGCPTQVGIFPCSTSEREV